jgi:hypothetical protein
MSYILVNNIYTACHVSSILASRFFNTWTKCFASCF